MHTCEQQKQSGKVELLPEHLYVAAHYRGYCATFGSNAYTCSFVI